MGAYNTLSLELPCPHCGRPEPVVIQFKYGDTWQRAYQINDALQWGGNDVGSPGKTHVVVDGVAESECPHCMQSAEQDFYVHVIGDRLHHVEPANGLHDFAAAGRSFIVLAD